ncbi:MAG: DUF5715 family protein [Bacteroidales bacterium]|nr:DUF5715 family protein [Bacteroidales bacterium]
MSRPRSSLSFNRLHFLLLFAFVILGLYGVKRLFPHVNEVRWSDFFKVEQPQPVAETDEIALHSARVDSVLRTKRRPLQLLDKAGKPVAHRILSVPDYGRAFPDLNDVQLATAHRIGVPTCADRAEAALRTKDLVFIGDSPYYEVENLSHSIPYLVPRAAALLEEIGRAFVDSLASKGLPFHKLRITSVLRTEDDVARLRRRNANASENSCHRFGTSFDISYNHYRRVQDPDLPKQYEVWGTKLKQILAEVLRDQRALGTCYVKYEVHQACFHITAR